MTITDVKLVREQNSCRFVKKIDLHVLRRVIISRMYRFSLENVRTINE